MLGVLFLMRDLVINILCIKDLAKAVWTIRIEPIASKRTKNCVSRIDVSPYGSGSSVGRAMD